MSIEIREMRIDHLAPVFHLGEKLFTSEEHPNLYRTWDEFEVTALFQSDPELCMVAEDEGMVAGFLMGTTIEKARTAWNYGHLLWLGIDDQYQRTGLGQRLFDAFKKTVSARGIRILIADTQADNERAIAFFHHQGFAQATEHVYLYLNLAGLKPPDSESPESGKGIVV
jgi:ribosomal protein S18 acetylase RimI-like enzyme